MISRLKGCYKPARNWGGHHLAGKAFKHQRFAPIASLTMLEILEFHGECSDFMAQYSNLLCR